MVAAMDTNRPTDAERDDRDELALVPCTCGHSHGVPPFSCLACGLTTVVEPELIPA